MNMYYKLHQRGQVWHYVQLLDDRTPKAVQVLNFLNPVPQVYFQEFLPSDPGDRVEYQALIASATSIPESEYQQAYQLATQGNFDVYTNGKKQQL